MLAVGWPSHTIAPLRGLLAYENPRSQASLASRAPA